MHGIVQLNYSLLVCNSCLRMRIVNYGDAINVILRERAKEREKKRDYQCLCYLSSAIYGKKGVSGIQLLNSNSFNYLILYFFCKTSDQVNKIQLHSPNCNLQRISKIHNTHDLPTYWLRLEFHVLWNSLLNNIIASNNRSWRIKII